MNNTFKTILFIFAIFFVFMWGYKKGTNKESGFKWFRPNKVNNSPVQPFKTNKLLRQQPTISPFIGKSSFLLNGVPTQFDVYTSKRSMDQEIAEYERKWRTKGLKVVKRNFENMNIVSGLDKHFRLFECAIMVPDPGSGKTLVIPAKLDLSKPPAQSCYKTPLYPLSQPLFHIESTDMGGYSENIILLSDASVSSIINFYEHRCLDGGWYLADPGKNTFHAPNSRQLLFLKKTDELWVNANRLEEENKTLVYLLYNDKL
jgi:hypothetical protein